MIFGILLIWLVTAFGLWFCTLIIPGIQVRRSSGLWLAALVLGLINAFIRPVLWILTLPLTVLTFGLFALVINALMIWVTAKLVDDFEVRDFFSAFLAALVMALLGITAFILLQWLMMDEVHWIMMGPGTYV